MATFQVSSLVPCPFGCTPLEEYGSQLVQGTTYKVVAKVGKGGGSGTDKLNKVYTYDQLGWLLKVASTPPKKGGKISLLNLTITPVTMYKKDDKGDVK